MARHSVALSAALMHTLIGIVCAMPAGPGAPSRGPGMAGRTISCPGCGLGFKTHRAVRQHQGHMAKTSKCFKDLRPPIPSAWSSGGARAAGRVEDLSRGGRLPGMTDSDTDSGGERSPRRMDRGDQPADGRHRQQTRTPTRRRPTPGRPTTQLTRPTAFS